MAAPGTRATGVVLFLAALAYFAAGAGFSLDWVDEGQILYFAWRVSEGAIPYRDFQNIYGPSVFLLNGGLLALFGPDVVVVRAGVVVLKASITLGTYLGACRLAPRAVALAAWLLAVAVLGLPWPYFTTPYANDYGLALGLAGVLVLSGRGGSPAHRAFLAGLCFGVAATFKQTNGLFFTLAAFVHLVHDRTLPAEPTSAPLDERVVTALRAARWIGLLGSACVFVAYAAHGGTWVSLAVVASPVLLVIALAASRELHAPPDAATVAGSFRGIVALALGAALPVGGMAAAYASIGELDALVFNLVAGLPQQIDWFVPLPPPGLAFGLFALAIGCALLAIRLGSAPSGPWTRGAVAAALVAVGAGVGLAAVAARDPVHWMSTVSEVAVLLPFALVAWAIVRLAGEPRASARDRGDAPATADFFLFTAFAAASLVFLHPAADMAHVFMSMPAVLPLAAPCLARISRGRTRLAAAILVLVLVAPFVWVLATTRAQGRIERLSLPHATGIEVGGYLYRDGALLARALAADFAPGRPLLVVSGKPLVYFVSGRPSISDADEFAFYLVSLGLVTDDAARRLVDTDRLVDALRAQRPIVVSDDFDAAAERFARAWPAAWDEIRRRTRVVRRAGRFEVRDWRSP